MSDFQGSSGELRNAGTNAATIAQAISAHPLHRLVAGDVGHAGVAAAVQSFREAWVGEYQLRCAAAADSGDLLRGAASDTVRVDELLAQAAARLAGG